MRDEMATQIMGEVDVLNKKIDQVISSSNMALTEGAAAVVAAVNLLPAAYDKEAARAANTAILGVTDRLVEIIEKTLLDALKNTHTQPQLQHSSIVPGINMWLAAAAGSMLAFLAGLAVHFESVSQLLMGTFIFVAGGISCFFFLRHKNKKQ
jgi:hypothetical protein